MSQYPPHWWARLELADKPDWEILPHEAAAGEVILSKRNELGLLSNLAPTAFELDGLRYASVEALWQMTKLPDSADPLDPRSAVVWPVARATMRTLAGLEAKRLGDQSSDLMKTHGWGWVSYSAERWTYPEKTRGPFYHLIRRALEAKLAAHREVRDVLRATRGLRLRPDHVQTGLLSPAHLYHEMWMELRDQ